MGLFAKWLFAITRRHQWEISITFASETTVDLSLARKSPSAFQILETYLYGFVGINGADDHVRCWAAMETWLHMASDGHGYRSSLA